MKEWQKRARQAYRARKLAQGKCRACGSPASAENKAYCQKHRIRAKILANLRYHRNRERRTSAREGQVFLDTGG